MSSFCSVAWESAEGRRLNQLKAPAFHTNEACLLRHRNANAHEKLSRRLIFIEAMPSCRWNIVRTDSREILSKRLYRKPALAKAEGKGKLMKGTLPSAFAQTTWQISTRAVAESACRKPQTRNALAAPKSPEKEKSLKS